MLLRQAAVAELFDEGRPGPRDVAEDAGEIGLAHQRFDQVVWKAGWPRRKHAPREVDR